MMSEKVKLTVIGAGERLTINMLPKTQLKAIIKYLKEDKGPIGALIRSQKYTLAIQGIQLNNLQIAFEDLPEINLNGKATRCISILDSQRCKGKQWGNGVSLAKKQKVQLSESNIVELLKHLDKNQINKINILFRKKEISQAIYDEVLKIYQSKKNYEKFIDQQKNDIAQLSSILESSAHMIPNQIQRQTLSHAKTFEQLEDFIIESSSKFIENSIYSNTKKEIQKVKSIYYDDGGNQKKNIHHYIDGVQNFLIFFTFEENILGLFSEDPLKKIKDQNSSRKGFFFSLTDQKAYNIAECDVLWKYSATQLKIGNDFISMLQGVLNKPPKILKNKTSIYPFVQKDDGILNEFSEKIKSHTFQLTSFEFLKVIFKENNV